MTTTPVRARTLPDIVLVKLSDLMALPDAEAAEQMNLRMGALDQIHRLYERSYSERGIIAREFERRQLWKHLLSPETGEAFPNFSAWMACSNFLGCRRTNFEAKRDMEALKDVPMSQLIDVPKGNIKLLAQLSTAVRAQPDVLEAARTMPREAFEAKVEKEHPEQHIESRRTMRFSPGRTGAKIVEEMLAYALANEIASSRDEALVRAAETALEAWKE